MGWPLLLAGRGLAAWAVRTAADVDLQRPGQLVLRANAAWPLLLLPGVVLATHVVVVREERFLEGRFGTAYRSYQRSVGRYL